MLSRDKCSNNSNHNQVLDGSTYIQIPVDALENTLATGGDTFEVVANVFLEQLSDGNFRLVREPIEGCSTSHFEESIDPQSQQNIFTSLPNNEGNLTFNICLDNSAEPLAILDNSVITNIIQKPAPKSETETTTVQPASPPNDPTYSCSTCNKRFETVRLYRDHLCNKKFMCTKCKASYNEENNLKIHMVLTHTDNDVSKCPICGINLTFQRTARLRSHMLMHQMEEIYSCSECGGEYDMEDEFLRHFERHKLGNPPKDDYLKCLHCKLKFEHAKDYRKHVSEHVKANKIFSSRKKKKGTFPKTKSSHVCTVCSKTFPKRSLLLRHERIHNGEKPFKCAICDKGFSQKGTLQTHWKRHAGIRPHECTLCPAKFTQKGNLRVHIRKTHTVSDENQKYYKCSQCSCIFSRISALNGHVTKIHSNPKPSNEIDDVMKHLKQLEKSAANMKVGTEDKETFTNENEQSENIHEEATSIETPAPPESNNEESDKSCLTLTTELLTDGTTKEHLFRHKRINDMHWYYCNVCPTRVKKPSDLIRHMRVHTKERPFKCKNCKAAFSLRSTLQYHMKTHRSNRIFNCPKCDFTAPTLRLLNAHRRKHRSALGADNWSWNCMFCDNRFQTFEDALKHKSESSDKFHISCASVIPANDAQEKIAGTVAVDLPDPTSESTKPKPFQCEICGIKFSRKISLTRHLQNHRGERKFKCSKCPKAFITLSRLKEHANFHNNIKNFGCKFCEKQYVNASLLKRHLLSHSMVRPFRCSHCSKTFKSVTLCRRHIKNKHRTDLKEKENVAVENTLAGKTNPAENLESVLIPTPDDAEPTVNEVQESAPSLDLLIQNLQSSESTVVASINHEEQPVQEQYQTVFLDIGNLKLLEDCNLDLNNVLQKHIVEKTKQQEPSVQDHSVSGLETLPTEIIQILNPQGIIDETVIHLNKISEENPSNTINNVTYETNNSELPDVISTNDLLNVLSMNSEDPNILNGVFGVVSDAPLDNNDIFEGTSIICRQCNNIFLSLELFQNHCCNPIESSNGTIPAMDQSVNVPAKMTVQCEKCQKFLKDEEALKSHMRLHTFKKSFECTVCNKVMVGRKTFQKHRATHAKCSNLYSCEHCSKDFKKASDLSRHVRTHTGEKPFACTACDKRFALKSTLESHKWTHEPNQKRFVCDICGSFFSSKPSLKLHMSIHTGQKPFSCTFCGQKFRTVSNRRSHEKLMHLSTKEKLHSNSQHPTNMRKVLESVAMDLVNNIDGKRDDNGENLLLDRLPSQVLNIGLSSEAVLTDMPKEQTVAVDASALLQQLQLNGNLAQSPLVLDDVTFFTLDSGKDENIQIISLSDLGLENSDVIIQNLGNNEPLNDPLKSTDRVVCDICQKRYSSKNVLTKHKKNVHGIAKNITCGKCNKRFTTFEERDAHDKLHQGYRPFSCLYCTNTFTEEHSYKTHMKRIHQQAVISSETTNALLSMNFDLKLAGDNIQL